MKQVLTVVTRANEKLLLNDVTYMTDAMGVLVVDIMEVLANTDNSTAEYGRIITTIIPPIKQQIRLLNNWVDAKTTTITEVAALLNISKEDAKELISLGVRHGILHKTINAWRVVSREKKDELKGLLLKLTRTTNISEEKQTVVLTDKEKIQKAMSELHESNEKEITYNPKNDEWVSPTEHIAAVPKSQSQKLLSKNPPTQTPVKKK